MTKTTLIKKFAAVIALASLSTATFASHHRPYQPNQGLPGFYIGFLGGYSQTHWNNVEGIDNKWVSDINIHTVDGAATLHPLVGYDINRFVALEAGYTYIQGQAFSITSPDKSVIYFDESVRNHLVDLSVKIKAPLRGRFGLFAKVGVVYMHAQNTVIHTDGTDPKNGVSPRFKKDDRNSINASVVIGGSYCFTPHITADLAWNHYRANADWGNKFIPDVSFFSLGLMYKFCA